MSDLRDQPEVAVATSLHTHVTDDASLRAALQRVAAAGCGLLSNCAAASITLLERGRPTTAGSSSEEAVALDQVQYDANAGPCLTAVVEDRIISVPDLAADDRWPEFRDAALEMGMRSSLSVPLGLRGETKGGLNIYGEDLDSFKDEDEQLAVGFAAQASVVVANAQAYWTAFDATRNLAIALENRAVIEQAKGILMARGEFTSDEAFDELRRRSQHANRRLRDIARELVEDAHRERER